MHCLPSNPRFCFKLLNSRNKGYSRHPDLSVTHLLTWIVLHHDWRHASVARVVWLVAMAIGVRSVHVGHVALVLRQGGGEMHVWGASLLPSTSVLIWSPALHTLLFLEPFLCPLPLLFPLPFTLSLPVVLPSLLLLQFRSFWVFAGVDVRPRTWVQLLLSRKTLRLKKNGRQWWYF